MKVVVGGLKWAMGDGSAALRTISAASSASTLSGDAMTGLLAATDRTMACLSRRVVASAGPGLRLNEWVDDRAIDGATIFEHACKLRLEGTVSKRKGLRYRSGRSDDWLKSKNPDSPAVRREAEEEWAR